jgi:hypothetical protein
MKSGRTLQLIKHLFGYNNGIPEMLEVDGLEERCKNRIKNKDKERRKLILKQLKIYYHMSGREIHVLWNI